MKHRGIVLSLCDRSAVAVEPWALAGYTCITVDRKPAERKLKNVTHIRADLLEWLPPLAQYSMVFAFPECTNTAVCGARYFQEKKLYGLAKSFRLIERCAQICEWSGAKWMVEHPVSTVSSYWRKPDYYFDPADYAGYLDSPMVEAYTKKTCIWAGGGFRMPFQWKRTAIHGSKMWKLPPTRNRAQIRSRTPEGFALAVYEANS